MNDRLRLNAEPISAETFQPLGDVLEARSDFGRTYFNSRLANHRPAAHCSLSLTHIAQTSSCPLTATEMERHEFSSQSFIPLDVSRYLIVVAPSLDSGQPDPARAKAFLVPGDVGITYGADVWHCPISILDRPARFAVLMWTDGSDQDEEFVQLENCIDIWLPSGK